MKKLFFIAALLLSSLLATAQVKISRENLPSDIEIQFKRCVVSGESGQLVLLVTNHGKEFDLVIGRYGRDNVFMAYDDEGNTLSMSNGGIVGFEFADVKLNMDLDWSFKFPSEVPLLLRINLDNISEYATKLTLIKIPFSVRGLGSGTILLRNVPFTRRD